MSNIVASGEVTVRDIRGNEWQEIVEVRETDLEWYDERDIERTVEDVAREQALRQSDAMETLAADLS